MNTAEIDHITVTALVCLALVIVGLVVYRFIRR